MYTFDTILTTVAFTDFPVGTFPRPLAKRVTNTCNGATVPQDFYIFTRRPTK